MDLTALQLFKLLLEIAAENAGQKRRYKLIFTGTNKLSFTYPSQITSLSDDKHRRRLFIFIPGASSRDAPSLLPHCALPLPLALE
jgi:hypothetical protein